MSEMFEKSIRTLELPAVLEMLSHKAVSDAAKERCAQLMPSTELEEVVRLLDETDAAKARLGLHGSPSFSGVKDVAQPLNRADHGGVLNTRELLDIAGVLTASRRVYEYDLERKGEATVIDRLFSALHTNTGQSEGEQPSQGSEWTQQRRDFWKALLDLYLAASA